MRQQPIALPQSELPTTDSARKPDEAGSGPHTASRSTMGCSSRRDGAGWVKHGDRPTSRMHRALFRGQERVTVDDQARHRGEKGRGICPVEHLAGAAGTAGCPEQNAPEHGRGRGGSESGSDRLPGRASRTPPARRTLAHQPGTLRGASNRLPRRARTEPRPGTPRRLPPQ